MWSAFYLYYLYLMSRNAESIPFSGGGVNEIAPSIQAKLYSPAIKFAG
jgi:hypothetical protein